MSAITGALFLAFIGGILALAGLARYEDAKVPYEHALALFINGAVYGGVLGSIVGIILNLTIGRRGDSSSKGR
jgi:hypothetical protein